MRIKFLGTGGGRFTMVNQKRATGGMIFYDTEGTTSGTLSLYVDPGPGALVYSVKEGINFKALDGLLVTHAHLDHSNDAEAIIEAITSGCKKERGILLANSTVLNGEDTEEENYTQVISDYHQRAVERIIEMKNDRTVRVKGRDLKFLRTKHGDPHAIAFKIDSDKTIGFITDTDPFERLYNFFSDCDYLVINVLRPLGEKWEGHLCIEDVAGILNIVKPKTGILHHFGYKMLFSSLKTQKEYLEGEIGDETEIIFANDFQEIDLKRGGLKTFM